MFSKQAIQSMRYTPFKHFRNYTAVAAGQGLRFDHVHLYSKKLTATMDKYKDMEKAMTKLREIHPEGADVNTARKTWQQLWPEPADPAKYQSTNQDVVKQLIFGAGLRIGNVHRGNGTESYMLAMSDSDYYGFHACVTAPSKQKSGNDLYPMKKELYNNFIAENDGRPGFGLLAFGVGKPNHLEDIKKAYETKHPELISTKDIFVLGENHRIFDVFAYYQEDNVTPDTKTIIRFVDGVLLPMDKVEHSFPKNSFFGYCDHWVSNVEDRTNFVNILNDCLGFSPKVNFNAGVVGAGEAVIESTVAGNSPGVENANKDELLKNEQQVYLPINNALSQHGHVHSFIHEMGQGIQHIATRVSDLPRFVEQSNWTREVTGEGFTFLYIPPSYYGQFDKKYLGIDDTKATEIHKGLLAAGLVNEVNVVDFDISPEKIKAACGELPQDVVTNIMRSVYNNLYGLMGDRLEADDYLRCVRNQVLMDIQGNDVLFQIFTSPVMHRDKSEQAPFFEFIQRVCSAEGNEPMKAGCGGFGIRNFLTLFLSIEVTKAIDDAQAALNAGQPAMAQFFQRRVEIFTEQQNVSNPLLTAISDAMTAKADYQEQAEKATGAEKDRILKLADEEETKRATGEKQLQETGDKYKKMMQDLKPPQ